ncbi:MAG: YbaB/EbfC family nucleoid-associated protein [Patescibacteria group bacterium]|jgi:DNA-binding protein YbaB
MLDKLKQLGQLKALQDQAKSEQYEAEYQGIRVIATGDLKVESIILNPDLPVESQGPAVKKCVNEALGKAQMGMAQKLSRLNIGF